MNHGNAPRRHTPLRLLALAALLGIAVVGLAQCRAVSDQLTGVELSTSGSAANARSECVHACNDAYKAAKKAEDERYRDALKACGGDDECRRAEQELHQRNHLAVVEAKNACKAACYNEGSGTAGR